MTKDASNVKLPSVTPHYLQSVIRERKIPLWQIRLALESSISEAKLSRILNGIEEMPKTLESRILKLLKLPENRK
jgi:hypothetical protein